MKFKIGDRVRILPSANKVGVESSDFGKIGTLSCIDNYVTVWCGFLVKMDKICKERGCICSWNVGIDMVKLVPKKGEQLLFDFVK